MQVDSEIQGDHCGIFLHSAPQSGPQVIFCHSRIVEGGFSKYRGCFVKFVLRFFCTVSGEWIATAGPKERFVGGSSQISQVWNALEL